MTLASPDFFLFLAVVLAVYHALRRRTLKYGWLTLASWVFYAWASPGYLWVILLVTVVDYWAGRKIEQAESARSRRRWLTLSVVSNLGLLAVFKYTTFVVDNAIGVGRMFGSTPPDRTWDILLPLGISFHTFQGISYTVDVYRGNIRAVRNFLDYALFVTFFPQLSAGPIVRAVEFLPQMVTPPPVTAERLTDGLRLFVSGLFKKLFIADQLHVLLVDPVFTAPDQYPAGVVRWAAVAWAVQIYCDFSGYTDIALGIGKWFGFDLPPNFHLPYLATSITDFWRRWHLSLSTWLRDYLYFPLGGSRHGEFRTHLNLMLVFVLCGLWHGAAWNWLVYGLYNGVLMSLHRVYDRTAGRARWRTSPVWVTIAWAVTFYQLLFGLVLIRMPDWASGLVVMKALAGLGHTAGSNPAFTSVPLPVFPLLALGMAGHLFALVSGRTTAFAGYDGMVALTRGVGYATAVVLLVTLGPGVTKSFIYIAF